MSKPICALAVDLGASHGRVIRGTLENGLLKLETVCDFPNQPAIINGTYYWNHVALAENALKGIEMAGPAASVGVDAWGHDYITVSKNGEIIGQMYCYRDPRTARIADYVAEHLDEYEAFTHTGEGVNGIATRVQLCAMKAETPDTYEAAAGIITVADYINYLLCGIQKCNETQVSMGGMMDLKTRHWCAPVLEKLGLRTDWGQIARCGEILGKTEDGTAVVAVAAHDTASALSFLPQYDDDHLLLSSGTWALVGAKTNDPVMTEETMRANLQVELGSNGDLLQINNLTGMWIMQELEREWGKIDYAALNEEAAKSDYCEIIDTQDGSLSLSGDMAAKITKLLTDDGKTPPATKAEYYRCVLFSLCKKFTDTIAVLERIYEKKYTAIHIVGGGAKNKYFNQLIADQTGKTVIAGPYEATAIGNILEQMVALGALPSREAAAEVIDRSFPPEIYQPEIHA